MAATPQQAVKDAIKTAGSERELRFRDAIHLPFHQVGMLENLPAIYLSEADVSEYRDSDWERSKPEWVGSTVKLLSMEEIIGDTKKSRFLLRLAGLRLMERFSKLLMQSLLSQTKMGIGDLLAAIRSM